MDPYSRSREIPPSLPQSITFAPPNQPPPDGTRFLLDGHPDTDKSDANVSFMKGPKRKRLAKACDACHKSKRRCDGTGIYFASKKCTYTDASGKPVPAPRPFKADRPEGPVDPRQSAHSAYPDGSSPSFNGVLPQSGDIAAAPADSDEDRASNSRTKRFRTEVNLSTPPSGTPPRCLAPPLTPSDRPLERDPALTRELVHLFFAYRQPQRMIIHQPTFLAALSHGIVPQHLLLAVCAVAAPLSRQSRLKTSPSRCAGEYFAQEAMARMFDQKQELICEKSLATAQALCLLQLHDRMGKSLWNGRYYRTPLILVKELGIFDSDNTVLTPVPSHEFINAAIERECARRVFWLIFISDCMGAMLYRREISATEDQLSLRLPVDEASFDLSPHTAIPEYIAKPGPSYAMLSEIGQLIRVLAMHEQVERAMNDFNNRESGRHPVNQLLNLEMRIDAWSEALPEHLRFNDENLSVQATMYETSANMGAWSFFAMHVIHSSCVFGLNSARQRCRTAMPHGPTWAHERLHKIIDALGKKAKLSILLGIAIWPLFKYVDEPHPKLFEWSSEFEEIWGVRLQDLCGPKPDYRQPSRAQPSLPPQIHTPAKPPSVMPSGPATPTVPTPIPRIGHDVIPPQAVQPSHYPPQCRASHDPRFHSQPQPSHPSDARGHQIGHIGHLREKDTRNFVNDTNIDPALQVVSNPRTHTSAQLQGTAPPPSLPSLKASGLLEWPLSGSVEATSAASGSTPTSWQVSVQHLGPRQNARDSNRPPSIQTSQTEYSTSPRPPVATAPSGMPVGLQWLAHETIASRQS
ncbi:hypothetical protein F5I97DRAFT_1974777 [Phlebopus sp. FC_14]|nr:hypothetical protein F5I97DRAFT_1974777 [Phlebopus sp. FC_14]